MRGSKSSAASPRSSLAGLAILLAATGTGGAWWCFARGYSLYYGDAEAHLNIARRILDSRTPGPEQIGTVWLPLPHLLLIPFVMRDAWWHSGLAGVLPSLACFVIAGMFLFSAARRVYGGSGAALAVTLLFALNPNILYLQATPMTELPFLASLAALLWATLWFRDSQSPWAVLMAAVASNAASLTRYEGWFLIPFVCLYLLVTAKRKWYAILFGALAALGPLAWLAHNQYYYSNALEFYNGPYSAAAIYHRQLALGGARYPGDHDWFTAARYYLAASRWIAGWPLLLMGIGGMLTALARKTWWPIFLLLLPPLFYVWSVHSSSTPIFVPDLPPYGWYNIRYAIAVVPLTAFTAGALVTLVPARFHVKTSIILALVITGVWGLMGSSSISWKESEVNSEARRAWTAQAASFLAREYRPGSGIIFPFGDLTGVLREAGIPLREGLHEGNRAAFDAAMARPDLLLRDAGLADWGLAFSGDAVDAALQKAGYVLRRQIVVKGAPVAGIYVDIYHRE
jgi:Dolichyl-phosphate-mannose-protein mannosyltransferase